MGGVRPDGSTITVNEDGVITAHATSTGNGILFPVGYVVMNTTGSDPANDFGGVWEERPSLGAHMWERTG